MGDWSKSDPLSPIVNAVAHHDVDVALVWGPVAGFYAVRQNPPLRVTPSLEAVLCRSQFRWAFASRMPLLPTRSIALSKSDRRTSEASLRTNHVSSSLEPKSATAE